MKDLLAAWLDVVGVGLLQELADELWQVLCDLRDLPALAVAIAKFMVAG